MSRAAWEGLLAETRAVWAAREELLAYCGFPDDIAEREVAARMLPPGALFAAETGLSGPALGALRTMVAATGTLAWWRETYKGTAVTPEFMDRFGTFTLIGPEGPYWSDRIRAWYLYMPAGLYYPWHQHVADEAYLVVGGEAVFRRAGKPDVTLGEGGMMFHESLEPHAMETRDHPVLALVVWRADFEHPPFLTYPDAR